MRRKSRADRRRGELNIPFPDRRNRAVQDVVIEVIIKETSAVIVLENSLLSANSYQIREAVDPIIEKPDIKEVGIELKKVPYMDSLVLGLMLEYHKTLSQSGKSFTLLNPQRVVRSLLRMMKLDRIFQIKYTSPDILSR